MSTGEGLALLDRALASGQAHTVPVGLDLASVRDSGTVPALLRGLVRKPRRRTADQGLLRDRLLALPEADRADVLLDLVRDNTAVVLQYATATGIAPTQSFATLGFDSLTAVELRNRLAAVVGSRLPTSLVFDYPTPALLGGHLLGLVLPTTDPAERSAETLDRLEAMLAEEWDGAEASKVTARLETLLVRWRDRSKTGGEAGSDGDDVLDSATDDEVLRYIDDEFGLI
ncbi:phosphopantetheine-binding protein [Streptomyces pratensis]|uniref:phosphopantetheine-binding protein n=1 Tax=Streptomyces pratensis TaxID=1169025 RepID=UPI003637535C